GRKGRPIGKILVRWPLLRTGLWFPYTIGIFQIEYSKPHVYLHTGKPIEGPYPSRGWTPATFFDGGNRYRKCHKKPVHIENEEWHLDALGLYQAALLLLNTSS